MNKFREWDKSLKVGDLVFSYFAGVWRILEIEKRNNASSPLVHLKKVATKNMLPTKATKAVCDIGWCKRLTQSTIDYMRTTGALPSESKPAEVVVGEGSAKDLAANLVGRSVYFSVTPLPFCGWEFSVKPGDAHVLTQEKARLHTMQS